MTNPGETPEQEAASSDDDEWRGGYLPKGPRPAQMAQMQPPPDTEPSPPQDTADKAPGPGG
jgi:hypothetical protein